MHTHSHGELGVAALLAAAFALVLLTGACGRTTPTPVESAGLDSEYVSVDDGDTCLVLALEDDGRFFVTQSERDCDGNRDRVMRPNPEPMASGSWVFAEGTLSLQGDAWTVQFEADSIRVEVPRRAGTLPSLRWVDSTEGSPFNACNLVSRSEFREFLDPSEGSGSSGGGL